MSDSPPKAPAPAPAPPRRKRFAGARRAWKKTRRLAKLVWHRAKTERASPPEIGQAVFLGVFAGCTPLVGGHGWIAVGLATLLRRNRLYAWLGSRVSNFVVLPFIVLAEVQTSRGLRTGAFAPLSLDHVLDQAAPLLLDWAIGSVIVGTALGLVFGLAAYTWSRRRDRLARSVPGPSAT